MRTQELVTKLLASSNWVDVALGRLLEPIDRTLYEITNLHVVAHVKYWVALLLAALKLRAPVDRDFDFPELDWSF